MTVPLQTRARDAVHRYFPALPDAFFQQLSSGWAHIEQQTPNASAQKFLQALPQGGWSCGIRNDSPTFTHPACPTLPSSALDALRELKPWRKGPWTFADTQIDAEWQSDQKWARITSLLPDLADQTILDVGSNNGYYAQRLLEAGAGAVFGLDPVPLYVAQAWCAEGLIPERPAYTLPIGIESLAWMPQCASLILLMGILYHRSDPIAALQSCLHALKPRGHILIETIIIPGQEDTALFVPKRYAGAKGFYWLPTLSCLQSWTRRSNLRILAQTDAIPTTADEQRSTNWRVGDSLPEGIDPNDPTRTIEGHPAPLRIALLCARG